MLLSKSNRRKLYASATLGLLSLSILFCMFIIKPAIGGDQWPFRKAITINHTKVAYDLTNFPVLIDIVDSDLGKAQDDGDDLLFKDELGNKLAHELELFDNNTDHLVAWVKVPTLSSTQDTKLYMYYGNPGAPSQQNVTGVWDTNFKMVQHLEETSGISYDSTAYGNNGTTYIDSPGSQNATGKIDGADYFDGSNDYIVVPHHSSLNPSDELTVSAWVKPTANGGFLKVVAKGKVYTSFDYWFWNNNGQLGGGYSDGGGQYYAGGSNTTLSLNVWQYVAMSMNRTEIRFYIDGALKYTHSVSGSFPGTSDSLCIACETPSVKHFAGTLDEIQISTKIRSASWISTSYNNQQNPSTFYMIGIEETIGAPTIFNENPPNGSFDIGLNPTLEANITDLESDSVDWLIMTNASGSWTMINSGTLPSGSGRVSATPTNMNSHDTKYYWSVNARDPLGSGQWTNKTYTFTTVPEPGPWWNTSWNYRRRIVIDQNLVEADLSDFPVLLNITDGNLTIHAQDDADDLVFTDYYGNKLWHEIEEYDNTTGHLVAWINVPSLSSIDPTTLYMYYGNPSAANQQSASGVWNSAFRMVQHLEERYPFVEEAQWQKYAGNPIVVASHGDPEIYCENGTYYLYNDKLPDQIDLWTSTDGVTYVDQGLILNFSASGWDSGAVRDPAIVKAGSTYHLYYAGSDNRSWPNSHHWMIGHATANSPLGPFTKDTDPIFNLTGYGVNEPDVIYEPDAPSGYKFKMTYTYASGGSGDDVGAGDIGYVHSEYANFSGYTNEGTILATTRGGQDVQDQCVIKVNDTYLLYYSVGNYQFDSANSTDFIHWTYQTDAALTRSMSGFDSGSIYSPSIDYDGTKYLMVYQASDGSSWQIGLATITSLPELQQPSWTVYDSTVNGINGTAYGVQTNVTGKINGADRFDGVNNYINVSGISGLTYPLTVELWISVSSNKGDNNYFSLEKASGEQSFILGQDDRIGNKNLDIVLGIYDGGWAVLDSGVTPDIGYWYYIVAVWKSDNTVELYVNGVSKASGSKSSISTWNLACMGSGRVSIDPRTVDGILDEVRVSQTARSSAWISTCYNNQHDPSSFCRVLPEEAILPQPRLTMDPNNVICKKYCEHFTVQINITYAFDVTDFEFEIHFNTTLLDYVSVTWVAWGTGNITVDETSGNITGSTSGSPVSGNLKLITMTFHAAYHYIWKDENMVQGWINNQTGRVWFHCANLSYTSGPDLRYEEGGLNQIQITELAYTFSPIQGDVDNDGDVDIYDLRTVAAYCDVKEGDPLWSEASKYDLTKPTSENIIDIYDLVVIGANFGFTYP